MIPSTNSLLTTTLKEAAKPGLTYAMDLEKKIISGKVDGINAMPQAIYKIIATIRYKWIIYSWNYGIELIELIGKPKTYCCPVIENRITEALIQDDRIKSVNNFEFDVSKRGVVAVSFNVNTIFGTVDSETEVSI